MSEQFPNGLLDGEFSGTEQATPMLNVTYREKAGTLRNQTMSAHMWGYRRSRAERLEPMTRPVVRLRIQFENGWTWEAELHRSLRSAGRAVTSEDDLPTAHREAMERGRLAAEKAANPSPATSG